MSRTDNSGTAAKRPRAARPVDPAAKAVEITCAGRRGRSLPVKVTVLPIADFHASAGVFVDIGYYADATPAGVESTKAERRVRAYRVAPEKLLRTGKSESFQAVIRLPARAAMKCFVRARFGGDGADIRTPWQRVAA